MSAESSMGRVRAMPRSSQSLDEQSKISYCIFQTFKPEPGSIQGPSSTSSQKNCPPQAEPGGPGLGSDSSLHNTIPKRADKNVDEFDWN